MHTHIQMRCAQIRHRAFFRAIANLFEIWGSETHGKIFGPSTVLHGGVCGVAEPPPMDIARMIW